MIFPTMGMFAAAWLLIVSFFGLETGFRADLAVTAGVLALPLAFASVWSFRAGIALAVVGAILAVVNLVVPASPAGLANYAVCAAALAIAGMAPQPVVSTEPVAEDEATSPMSRMPPPHATQAPHPAPA